MKWFKHISESGDDPDIGAILDKFGYKGYYMFFRTIEVMSKEFDIDNPGVNKFSFSWFLGRFPRNIDKKTLIKFLNFTNEIGRIMYILNGKDIHLKCLKLKILTDDYTARVLAGKKIDYGLNWSEQRKKCRARDNYICQGCGKTTQEHGRSLNVHHIIPFEEFNNYKEANKLENLTSLCITCHNKRRKQVEAVSTSNSTTFPLSNEEVRSKKKEVRSKKEEEKKNKPLVPDDKKHHPKPSKINFNFEKNKSLRHEVINYLNEKTGKSFGLDSKDAIQYINGRIDKNKATFEKFKYIIDIKTGQWLNDDEYNKYLRPSTLFRESNFENYLNEKIVKKRNALKEWAGEETQDE